LRFCFKEFVFKLFYKKVFKPIIPINLGAKMALKVNGKEGEFLLDIARLAIESKFRGENFHLYNMPYPNLNEKRGVFVTLTKSNELRGCIGNIHPVHSIYQSVVKNTISAAFSDNRFKPITKDELKNIKIEVSILTEPAKLLSKSRQGILDKIVEFKHGIVMINNMNEGVFLPQVWEQLPKKEDFLNHLCLKACILPEMWHDKDTEIYLFEVQKFKEEN